MLASITVSDLSPLGTISKFVIFRPHVVVIITSNFTAMLFAIRLITKIRTSRISTWF